MNSNPETDQDKNTDTAREFLLKEYDYFTDSFHKNEAVGEKRVDFFTGFVTAVIGGLVALINSDNGIKDQPLRYVIIAGLAALLLFGWITLLRLLKRNKATDEFKKNLDNLRKLFRKYYGTANALAEHEPFKNGKQSGQNATQEQDQKEPEKKCMLEFTGLAQFIARKLAQQCLLAKYGEKFVNYKGKESPEIKIENFLRDAKTRSMGGLVDFVAVINALLCAGLAAALIYQQPDCIESIRSKIGNPESVAGVAIATFAVVIILHRIHIVYYHLVCAFEIEKPWKHTNSG